MKTLAIFVNICAAINAFSQGIVNFGNHPDIFADGIDRRVYFDFVGSAGVTGTDYVAQLWYGPDANNISSVAPQLASFRPVGDPRPGVWIGGIRTLNGFGPGQTTTLQVKVWDVTRYSTYEEASRSAGAIFGASQPFNYTVPPVGTTEGFTLDNLRAFALIPEPSVLFLGSLGAAFFFLFTKRKSRPEAI